MPDAARTLPDLADPAVSRLVVTGHPNHELAILGLVQRLRPRLLFLTDGGGPERVEETRRALDTLGLLDRAQFLGWPEATLYRALLTGDPAPFAELVAQIRQAVEAWAPRQILSESVELYNPLHDITLPLVRAATRGRPGIELLEFPLIAQIPAPGERYRVQRLPAARAEAAATLRLTEEELAAKLQARDAHYPTLRRQLGALLDGLDREYVAHECFAPAPDGFPIPGESHVLRYEWRARLLHAQGEIDGVITFSDHFLPLVAAL